MADPFIGEIRMFGGNFAPQGWALCNGQLMAISQNDALFSLIGTTYGGDGQSTFALPNLQGRFPIHQGPGFVIGQIAGTEQVTLTQQQLPAHRHTANGAEGGNQLSPENGFWSTDPGGNTAAYNTASDGSEMAGSLINPAGGNQPHDNMQPFLVINYIISLNGIYPTQN